MGEVEVVKRGYFKRKVVKAEEDRQLGSTHSRVRRKSVEYEFIRRVGAGA